MSNRKETRGRGAYFPRSYLTDMFRFFERNQDRIAVITYQEIFADSDDFDYLGGYPREKKQWLKRLATNEIDATKAYVLLQYDIDSSPQRTMDLLEHPAHENVPANIMRFVKRVDRILLKAKNKLAYTDYKLDIELLNRLARNRFVIGYHSNCYERSHYDEALASTILEEDIQTLQQIHDINFFTAHGGVPCVDGKNNREIMPPDSIAKKVRWVHNGATPFFNKQFSDGGHNSPHRDPADRDLRDFVRGLRPGERYRILIHPQYYSSHFGPSKRFSGTPWYDEMVRNVRDDSDYDSWKDVMLEDFDKPPVDDSGASLPRRAAARLKRVVKSKMSRFRKTD